MTRWIAGCIKSRLQDTYHALTYVLTRCSDLVQKHVRDEEKAKKRALGRRDGISHRQTQESCRKK